MKKPSHEWVQAGMTVSPPKDGGGGISGETCIRWYCGRCEQEKWTFGHYPDPNPKKPRGHRRTGRGRKRT